MPEPICQFTVYRNGNIYTMEDKDEDGRSKKVDCLAVSKPGFGGKIEYAGPYDDLPGYMKTKGSEYDLKGKTLMPGFIDPHVHPSMAGIILNTKFITPLPWNLPGEKPGEIRRVEGTTSEAKYKEKLEEWVEEEWKNCKDDTKFMITWGYVSQYHGANIDRAYLDAVCKKIECTRPIIVWQYSFHMVYLNTRALDLCYDTENGENQDKNSTTMPIKDENEGWDPTQMIWDRGQFFEGGLDKLMAGSKFNEASGVMETLDKGYLQMVEMCQNAGITAIADLEFPAMELGKEIALGKEILDKSCEDGGPSFSTFLVPSARMFARESADNHDKAALLIKRKAPDVTGEKLIMFDNHVKFLNDGAFFSQTMQMLEPYTDDTPEHPHKGAWTTEPKEQERMFEAYWKAGFQIHLHTNGDGGMANLLKNVKEMVRLHGRRDTHRTTVEHAGFFTKEQADELKEYNCLVSAQPYYNYILAEKYSEEGGGLGKRGKLMTPLQYLVERDVPFALHSDLCMAPAEPLLLAWCAINRLTETGNEISPDLKIPVWDGMKAITSNAAYILGQQDSMGTLTVGKLANLTIIMKDPFEDENKKIIKDIKVYGTVYKGGNLKVVLNCDKTCKECKDCKTCNDCDNLCKDCKGCSTCK